MTKEKARYLDNRARVFEIQKVDKKRKDINCHHIIQRCDVGVLVGWDFDVDAKSNLFPVTLAEHEYINERIRQDDVLHCCELHPRLNTYHKKRKPWRKK